MQDETIFARTLESMKTDTPGGGYAPSPSGDLHFGNLRTAGVSVFMDSSVRAKIVSSCTKICPMPTDVTFPLLDAESNSAAARSASRRGNVTSVGMGQILAQDETIFARTLESMKTDTPAGPPRAPRPRYQLPGTRQYRVSGTPVPKTRI